MEGKKVILAFNETVIDCEDCPFYREVEIITNSDRIDITKYRCKDFEERNIIDNVWFDSTADMMEICSFEDGEKEIEGI